MPENSAPIDEPPSGNLVIAVASDHAGFELKEIIKAELEQQGQTVVDLGTNGTESVDYAEFGFAMADALADGLADRGVVVCGSGIGISIAANRHPFVRAAVCTNETMARLARLHNDANVLALGSRIVGTEVAKECVSQFLKTPFEGGRHARRVDMLSKKVQ